MAVFLHGHLGWRKWDKVFTGLQGKQIHEDSEDYLQGFITSENTKSRFPDGLLIVADI